MAWFRSSKKQGGGSSIVEKRYGRFAAIYGLRLPDKFALNGYSSWNLPTKIELKVFSTIYRDNKAYLWNSDGESYSCFREYNNKFYASSGTSSRALTDWSAGEHVFIEDYNVGLFLDGTNYYSYSSTSRTRYRILGPGIATYPTGKDDVESDREKVCLGWFMYLKIYDKNNNNELVCHIVPAEVDGVPHLYDKVTGEIYHVEEFYVTDTTPTNKVSYRVYTTDTSVQPKIRITKYYDDVPADSKKIDYDDCDSTPLTVFDDISVDFRVTDPNNDWTIKSLCNYLKYNNVNYGTNEEVTHFAYNVDTDFMMDKVSS